MNGMLFRSFCSRQKNRRNSILAGKLRVRAGLFWSRQLFGFRNSVRSVIFYLGVARPCRGGGGGGELGVALSGGMARPCPIVLLPGSAICPWKWSAPAVWLSILECTRLGNNSRLFSVVANVQPLLEWSMSNFSCSLTRNTTSHSMKNLDFHSLSEFVILPILTTSFIHPSLKDRENVLFELRSERVKITRRVASACAVKHCGVN